MEEQRALPKSIDYSDVLPQAVPAVAKRKKFYPVNGADFTCGTTREIRIPIHSSNGLMDCLQSYLEFEVFNDAAALSFAPDLGGGTSFFEEIRIEQGGRVLTKTNEFNRLHAAILSPCQDHFEAAGYQSIASQNKCRNGVAASGGGQIAVAVAGGNGDRYSQGQHQSQNRIPAGSAGRVSIPLPGGLFTQDKLIPLPLVSPANPITLVMVMDTNVSNLGIFSGVAPNETDIRLSRISVNAQIIEVGRDVIEQIRMTQEMMGGQLVISGQDFEHNQGALPAPANVGVTGEQIIRVPFRKRSIKSIFFIGQSDTFANGGGAQAAATSYNLSYAGCMNLLDYQIKVGSVVYPPTPIRAFQAEPVAANGEFERGEALMELSKALGSLGSTAPSGNLNTYTYGTAGNGVSGITNGDTGDGAGATLSPESLGTTSVCPFGLSLESFQHTAQESGIDTQTMSLETNLILNIGPGDPAAGVPITGHGLQPKNVHTFILYDQHYYFNADGMITFSN